MASTMSRPLRKVLKGAALFVLYIAVWQVLSMLVDSHLLLPSPWDTARSFGKILTDGEAWKTIGFTFLRILSGFVLGCLFGVLLAILTANSKVFAFLLSPLRTLIKTTPITSFALLLLIAVVSNLVPVVVSMIVVIPMIWQTTEQAILSLDPKLDEMARLYFRPWKRHLTVSVPQILPQFTASAATALGFAWKAVITAEILALPQFGIGNEMYLCKLYLEYADLFAWTLLVIGLSVLMEQGFRLLVKRTGGVA